MMPRLSTTTALVMSAILLAACSPQSNTPAPFATLTPGSPTAPTSQPTSAEPVEATTAAPASFYIQPGVPQNIAASVVGTLAQAGYVQTATPDGTVLRVVLDPPQDAALNAQWVYALVEPFAIVQDEVTGARFLNLWAGNAEAQSELLYAEPSSRLVLTQNTADLLAVKLGARPSEADSGVPLLVEPDPAVLVDT